MTKEEIISKIKKIKANPCPAVCGVMCYYKLMPFCQDQKIKYQIEELLELESIPEDQWDEYKSA